MLKLSRHWQPKEEQRRIRGFKMRFLRKMGMHPSVDDLKLYVFVCLPSPS